MSARAVDLRGAAVQVLAAAGPKPSRGVLQWRRFRKHPEWALLHDDLDRLRGEVVERVLRVDVTADASGAFEADVEVESFAAGVAAITLRLQAEGFEVSDFDAAQP